MNDANVKFIDDLEPKSPPPRRPEMQIDKPLKDLIKTLAVARDEHQKSPAADHSQRLHVALSRYLSSQGVILNKEAVRLFKEAIDPHLKAYIGATGNLGLMDSEARIKIVLDDTIQANKAPDKAAAPVVKMRESFHVAVLKYLGLLSTNPPANPRVF